MAVPHELLLSNLKPLLMQLKVSPPELIHLTGDLNTFAFSTHPGTHLPSGRLHILASRRHLRPFAMLLSATTGGTQVPTVRLVTWQT